MALWICESCNALVRTDQLRGNCAICGVRTCVSCLRVCDRCHQIVCPKHIETRDVWKAGKFFMMKLCTRCRGLV